MHTCMLRIIFTMEWGSHIQNIIGNDDNAHTCRLHSICRTFSDKCRTNKACSTMILENFKWWYVIYLVILSPQNALSIQIPILHMYHNNSNIFDQSQLSSYNNLLGNHTYTHLRVVPLLFNTSERMVWSQ